VFGKEAGAPIAGPALVVAELQARQLDKVAEVAASLIERAAKNAVYHTLLGEVRATQQDYSAAESALRAALAIDRPHRRHWRSGTDLYGNGPHRRGEKSL
jgi:hypothetical protein